MLCVSPYGGSWRGATSVWGPAHGGLLTDTHLPRPGCFLPPAPVPPVALGEAALSSQEADAAGRPWRDFQDSPSCQPDPRQNVAPPCPAGPAKLLSQVLSRGSCLAQEFQPPRLGTCSGGRSRVVDPWETGLALANQTGETFCPVWETPYVPSASLQMARQVSRLSQSSCFRPGHEPEAGDTQRVTLSSGVTVTGEACTLTVLCEDKVAHRGPRGGHKPSSRRARVWT